MPLKTNIHQFFASVVENVRPKHQKLVDFGLHAYSLTPFQSAASNARKVVPVFSTACRKSERLLKNEQIGDELNAVLSDLVPITPNSIVNVDHTDSDLLTSLVGAVQTKKGRAIPVFVESTYSNGIPSFGSRHSTSRTDQLRRSRKAERKVQSFSKHITSAIGRFVDCLGFVPKFAFDRGFGGLDVILFLDSIDAIFYIRLKSKRTANDGYGNLKVRDLPSNDEVVELDGLLLRVVRSNKSHHYKEPWYILTNDFSSNRDRIIRIYYHRFEIEEIFKDMKNLFELRRVRFNRPNSLKVILQLVFIGIIILYRLSQTEMVITIKRLRSNPTNPKKVLSWVRESWEMICLLGWR